MKKLDVVLDKVGSIRVILIIMVIWFIGIGYLSAQQTQKQDWGKAEIVSGEGETIHEWDASSFTQLITQRVCNKNFLVINSTDPKILQMISPSSVFDISTVRSFEQVGKVEKAERDSTQVIYKLEFKSLNYPERLLLFTDSSMSFMMFMTNRDMALVLHNNKKQ
jgi:hypothetical protein